MSISFTPSIGGYIIRLNRALIGLIMNPLPDESEWRIITEHGEMSTAPTLQDAKRIAADYLLLDHAY